MQADIEFEVVEETEQIPAFHKHNALVHSPFTWGESEDAQ